MVSMIDLLKQCMLLAIEARHPQQWYKSTSARLRDASGWIQALLDRDSPYLGYEQPKDGRDGLDAWIHQLMVKTTPKLVPTSKRSLHVRG
jgi:hypothetical protein